MCPDFAIEATDDRGNQYRDWILRVKRVGDAFEGEAEMRPKLRREGQHLNLTIRELSIGESDSVGTWAFSLPIPDDVA